MKREHIESLAELCREWIRADGCLRKEFNNGDWWDFEELEEENASLKKKEIEKDIMKIVEKLCRK